MDVKLVYNFERRTEADGVRKEGHRDSILSERGEK
jgi:hypothetical protein